MMLIRGAMIREVLNLGGMILPGCRLDDSI